MEISRLGYWLSGKAGHEMVIMSVESGQYIGLTEVGARIWEMIEIPRTFEYICNSLGSEFNVKPEICSAEVMDFIKDLASDGALTIKKASSELHRL